MAKKRHSIPVELVPWIEARQRFRLSHAHVQMARELGLNPKKFGGLDNQGQETWKQPLPDFIAGLYLERFERTRPDPILTIEEMAAAKLAKKQARKAARKTKEKAPPTEL
jgi:hypothetical protein